MYELQQEHKKQICCWSHVAVSSVQLAVEGRHSPECYNSSALFFFCGYNVFIGREKGQTTTLSIKRHKRAKGGGWTWRSLLYTCKNSSIIKAYTNFYSLQFLDEIWEEGKAAFFLALRWQRDGWMPGRYQILRENINKHIREFKQLVYKTMRWRGNKAEEWRHWSKEWKHFIFNKNKSLLQGFFQGIWKVRGWHGGHKCCIWKQNKTKKKNQPVKDERWVTVWCCGEERAAGCCRRRPQKLQQPGTLGPWVHCTLPLWNHPTHTHTHAEREREPNPLQQSSPVLGQLSFPPLPESVVSSAEPLKKVNNAAVLGEATGTDMPVVVRQLARSEKHHKAHLKNPSVDSCTGADANAAISTPPAVYCML